MARTLSASMDGGASNMDAQRRARAAAKATDARAKATFRPLTRYESAPNPTPPAEIARAKAVAAALKKALGPKGTGRKVPGARMFTTEA